MVWAKNANGVNGLVSASASDNIPSNCSSGAGTIHTLSAGNEGYNTGTSQSQVGGSGTISLNSVFADGGTPYRGGGLCSTYQTLATSNGTADTAVITLKNNASINPTTPAAADYTDTITVVGAGNF
jgi:hypothetical protein